MIGLVAAWVAERAFWWTGPHGDAVTLLWLLGVTGACWWSLCRILVVGAKAWENSRLNPHRRQPMPEHGLALRIDVGRR